MPPLSFTTLNNDILEIFYSIRILDVDQGLDVDI